MVPSRDELLTQIEHGLGDPRGIWVVASQLVQILASTAAQYEGSWACVTRTSPNTLAWFLQNHEDEPDYIQNVWYYRAPGDGPVTPEEIDHVITMLQQMPYVRLSILFVFCDGASVQGHRWRGEIVQFGDWPTFCLNEDVEDAPGSP